MLHLFTSLELHTGILLLLALVFILCYEAINGFHDTANVIATVIYTRAMQLQSAVIMAAVFNFFGVIFSGLKVAYAIIHMLPTNLLLNTSSNHSLAMMFSLLLAAIIWNLSTWYFGLPTSSSHTLIGAIIGIELTNILLIGTSIVDTINLSKVFSIFASLIISPIIGLIFSGVLIFILHSFCSGTQKLARIHLTPAEREKKYGKKKPSFWIRTILILSSIGVAFSHGANDGQKGIGLMMLVLVGIVPANFVVNMNASDYEISRTRDAINNVKTYFQQHPLLLRQVINIEQTIFFSEAEVTLDTSHNHVTNIINNLEYIQIMLTHIKSYEDLTIAQRNQIRRIILCVSDLTDKITSILEISNNDKFLLKKLQNDMLYTIEYAPLWIIIAIALALSIGTMIGWRRIAITIGEKIGKRSLTYAQGLSAQITAAISIGFASYTGMPVSTTHVLSSSIAGTMIICGGGLQRKTVINIMMAWIFTLPVSIALSGWLYWIILKFL